MTPRIVAVCACGLLGCVGDSTLPADAGGDATVDAPFDAAMDVVAETGDAGAEACAPAPDASPGSGCTGKRTCLTEDAGIVCGTGGVCPSGSLAFDCYSKTQCAGGCCTNVTSLASICPRVATVDPSQMAVITCAVGNCPSSQAEICVSSSECAGGQTCVDTVFDFGGKKIVHVGTCQ